MTRKSTLHTVYQTMLQNTIKKTLSREILFRHRRFPLACFLRGRCRAEQWRSSGRAATTRSRDVRRIARPCENRKLFNSFPNTGSDLCSRAPARYVCLAGAPGVDSNPIFRCPTSCLVDSFEKPSGPTQFDSRRLVRATHFERSGPHPSIELASCSGNRISRTVSSRTLSTIGLS